MSPEILKFLEILLLKNWRKFHKILKCWKTFQIIQFLTNPMKPTALWTQPLILHKMHTFTGTLNLSRFGKNWDVVVTNEFHSG